MFSSKQIPSGPFMITYSICGLTAESFDPTRRELAAEMARLVSYAELAEANGLDGVFVSEHHAVDEGHLSAPFVALGAIAQATERVRIGTNIALAPLYHPVRLAEDVAAVDLLSGGRAVLGIGLGYRPEEFNILGVPRSERSARLTSAILTLRAAWSGEPITTSGSEPVRVTPPPLQEPGVPIWVGAFAEVGVRRARRLGDGFIAPTVSVRAFDKRVGWLAEEGSLDGFDIAVPLNGFVGSGDVWSQVASPLTYIERRYKRWQVEAADLPRAVEFKDRYEELGRPPHLVVGNPDECVEQLRPWVGALGSLPDGARGHLQIRLTYPGIDPELARQSVRLFGTEVVPRLREIESARS
ncbi:MAG: LLM class flavin-dependent oxidoreductase [Acidimicrobiia bacterium]